MIGIRKMITKEYLLAYQKALQKKGLLELLQLQNEKIEELYIIHGEILKR